MAAEQSLDLNVPDFERAGMARKSGYKFLIKFSKGRVDNVIIDHPLASNLASVLLGDETIKNLFLQNDYQISMNPKFQLAIKLIPSIAADEEKSLVTENNADSK